MDVIEEVLIDLATKIDTAMQRSGAVDGRPFNPMQEEAIVEILTAAPPRNRAKYVDLIARFFRDLDLQLSAVVPPVEAYRQALRHEIVRRLLTQRQAQS